MWQDYVMTLTNLFFIFGASKQAMQVFRTRNTEALNTSQLAITGAGLMIMAVCLASLGAYLSSATCAIQAVIWASIFKIKKQEGKKM